MKILSDPQLKKIVRLAIKEDLGELGDITSNTVLTKRDRATFHFVSTLFDYSIKNYPESLRNHAKQSFLDLACGCPGIQDLS